MEGALYAAHQKLDNLIAFVDDNKKQLDGYTRDVNDLTIWLKIQELRLARGKSRRSRREQVYNAIMAAKEVKGKPSMIVLDTVRVKAAASQRMQRQITIWLLILKRLTW